MTQWQKFHYHHQNDSLADRPRTPGQKLDASDASLIWMVSEPSAKDHQKSMVPIGSLVPWPSEEAHFTKG